MDLAFFLCDSQLVIYNLQWARASETVHNLKVATEQIKVPTFPSK